MKKILLSLTLMILFLSSCGNETPMDEGLDPDMVATVVAEMMAATASVQMQTDSQAPAAPTEVPTEEDTPTQALSDDFENAAPVQTQLIIGIYQLENTALTITKEQASALYPYFFSLQESMTNNTLTEEEIDALVLQQTAVLTAEQIQSIINMQITQDSIMTTMEELGITMMQGGFGNGQRGGGGGSAGGEGGAPPTDGSGAPQGGGGGEGGGGQTGTAPEGGDERNGFVPPELIEAIITLMESKINS